MTVSISILMSMVGSTLTGKLGQVGSEFAKKRLAETFDEADLPPLFDLADSRRDESLLNAMYVLSVLSALEACVEDLTKAALMEDRSLFQQKQFSRLRLTAAQAFADEDDRIHFVYEAIKDAAGLSPGVNRYENILQYVGLGGAVPDEITTKIYEAQAVRNVWAHSAGIADRSFIERVPNLRWNRGDLVDVTLDETQPFVTSVLFYGMILANRHRTKHGLPVQNIDQFDTERVPLAEAFLTFYATEDSEPDKSPTASDDPLESPAPPIEGEPPAQTSSPDRDEDLQP